MDSQEKISSVGVLVLSIFPAPPARHCFFVSDALSQKMEVGILWLRKIILSDKMPKKKHICSVTPFYHYCRVWSVDFFSKFSTRHFSSLTKNSFIFHGRGRNDPRSSTTRPRLERDLWSEIPRLHLAAMMRWLLRGSGGEGGGGAADGAEDDGPAA